MSAVRWRRCGRALGSLPSDGMVRARWVELLHDELPGIEPFLRRQGSAAVIRRPDAAGRAVTWRVVRHSKTDLVGIDDDSGERIDLRFEDVQIWSIDWPRVITALRAGLGLSGTPRALPDAALTWEVGRLALNEHQTAPIFLCGAPRHRLGTACDRICAEGLQGGVLLVGDPAVAPPEAVARLGARTIQVVEIGDAIATDDRGRLVGISGPDSVVGDLRFRLGLAPGNLPAFQFMRTGNRWDIRFEHQPLCIEDQKGLHYICMLLEKPNVPIEAEVLFATVAGLDRHLLHGSTGVVTDRKSRDEYMSEYRKLHERIGRMEPGNPERDRLEIMRDRIMEALKEGDGLGGEDRELTSSTKIGRGVGMAINRAIEVIAEEDKAGIALAAHLQDAIRNRTGQKPVYRPSASIAWATSS